MASKCNRTKFSFCCEFQALKQSFSASLYIHYVLHMLYILVEPGKGGTPISWALSELHDKMYT